MTPERFATLLDAYGGDPKRWPAAERGDAEAYLAATPAARGLIDDALRLDALIDAAVPPAAAVDAGRIAALAAGTAQEPAASVLPFRPRASRARPFLAWARAGALAAAGIAGLIVGMGNVSDNVQRNAGSALELYDAAQVEDASW
ncbi:MAG: hypothetical protein IT562_00180 [Alphaproteobacteria bacterium]|nr:hypothetical protein [Alphaproteobacteria bacterium]